MRDYLIGYLMDALEPAEREMVEVQLSQDPQLSQELELCDSQPRPAGGQQGPFRSAGWFGAADVQLRDRAEQGDGGRGAPAYVPSRWRLTDMAVAAGIFLAACLLFFPAVTQSRFAARLAGCQNNLALIGKALSTYSELHNGYFPDLPQKGRCCAAGIYATRLYEHGFINSPQLLVCPASALADNLDEFRVPTTVQLQSAADDELIQLERHLGGSYGYTLGYMADGVYHSTKNLHRKNFAIMADMPSEIVPHASPNHGSHGQNVLFEDMHVQYLTTCKAPGTTDNIFLNARGKMAPGLNIDDAVVGTGRCKPRIVIEIVPRGR